MKEKDLDRILCDENIPTEQKREAFHNFHYKEYKKQRLYDALIATGFGIAAIGTIAYGIFESFSF